MEILRPVGFRFNFILKILYIIIVTGTLYYLFYGYVYDDPFITYRYSRNLGDGIGFVYNQGEYVLSTTTPLFALLLGVADGFRLDIHLFAKIIGALSVALGGLLLWELGKAWNTPMVGWSGLLLYPTNTLLLSTMGSETPLFLALILGAFVLYAKHHYGWSLLLITLAILTRSDGVLAGIILGGHYIWMNRNQIYKTEFWREQPWFWFIGCVGLLMSWHLFAWDYFGSPLPVTLAVKQAQARMSISHPFAQGLLRIAGWYTNSWFFWVEFCLLLLGLVHSIYKKYHWVLIWAWTGLYFLAYMLLGVPGYFWYYAPLVPGWVIGVGLGISYLTEVSLPDNLWCFVSRHRFRFGIAGLLLFVIFVGQVINTRHFSQQINPRYIIYKAAGEWLIENTPGDADVGALEVGIIGYISQRLMLDFAGLIQPEVADQMQQDITYDDTALWAMKKYEPDYLVIFPDSLPQVTAEIADPYCLPVQSFAGSKYEFTSDLYIYRCEYD